tara:strand:- start:20 stop:664 length:645 start_codon:yes stop_codon:yes gene_type:complete
MCGRFVNTKKTIEIENKLKIDENQFDELSVMPSYNICPTQYSPVVIQKLKKRTLKSMFWGLIPSWSKDESYSSKLINARFETIKEKPSFKTLVDVNRCIVIASGYYEWTQTENGKQPVFIHNNGDFLLLAGLWSQWKDISSFTIITKLAEKPVDSIHARMPLILDDNCIESYLDNSIPFDQSFKPTKSLLKFHNVSTRVNAPVNNNPSCIDELK